MQVSPDLIKALFDKESRVCTNFVEYCTCAGLNIEEVSLSEAKEPVYLVWKEGVAALLYGSDHGTALKFWLCADYNGRVSTVCGCCDPAVDTIRVAALVAKHNIKSIAARKPQYFKLSPIGGLVEEDWDVSYKLHEMVGVNLRY
jgi:hypothetical protein